MPHQHVTTEEELLNMLSGKKPKPFINLWWILAIFVFLTIIITLFINYYSVKTMATFWFSTQVDNISYENPAIEQVVNNQETVNNSSVNVPVDSILIDKINVQAPIIYDVPNETQAVAASLANGVIHLKGTAHPGEIGNVFITGHSSNFIWQKGNYNSIFALLNNLENGDNIVINYQKNLFYYQVKSKTVVEPTDLSPLVQTDRSELTLMTCTPVGTNLRRLIVKADQLKPNPVFNTRSTNSTTLSTLPNIKR